MKYKNPIISGFYPDPSICRVNDDYYLVTSSFEYLPGVPLFHSKDLVNWNQIGHCLTSNTQIDLRNSFCSGGIFAPTIRYNDGTFYMITTNILKGNFIVRTTDPKKGWSDPIWVDVKGIDPSLYWENNKVYMQLSTRDELGNGIIQCEIDINTGKILSEPKIITRGTGGRDVEAPHVYKINDYYYLLLAEGGTREGHMVTIMRSKSIWGPFEFCPNNPILSNVNYSKEELQGVGHADLFEDHNGNWWVVALAHRPIKHKHVLGRETILLPVKWDKDGWPIVHKGYAESFIDTELLLEKQKEIVFEKDNFLSSKLNNYWNTMREFINEKYSLSEKHGSLCLLGDELTLNDLAAPAFIARRQQHFECKFVTKIEFNPKKDNEEAGLAIYIDNDHHMELVISKRNNKKVIVVRKNVADIKVESFKEITEDQEIYLSIVADEKNYSFYYGNTEDEFIYLDKTMTKHLATEVANSEFTGVYCGMYSSGNGEKMKEKAYFSFFNYISS